MVAAGGTASSASVRGEAVAGSILRANDALGHLLCVVFPPS